MSSASFFTVTRSTAWLLCALSLLTGCTTTQQAVDAIADRWYGQPVSAFVRTYGIPSSTFVMDDGFTVYEWGDSDRVQLPPSTSTSTNYDVWTNTYVSTTVTEPGGSLDLVCVLQIVADSQGRMSEFTILRDTWGRWEISRCNEIYG